MFLSRDGAVIIGCVLITWYALRLLGVSIGLAANAAGFVAVVVTLITWDQRFRGENPDEDRDDPS